MIIGDSIIEQEKELLTEILYNRKAVLAWDFTDMGKIKREVSSPEKIQTIDYKPWQIPRFQIFSALTSTIIDML